MTLRVKYLNKWIRIVQNDIWNDKVSRRLIGQIGTVKSYANQFAEIKLEDKRKLILHIDEIELL